MERFRDLYAKMASSGGRTNSSRSPSDKPPLDATRQSLKFSYEPKHCRPTLNDRIEDAIQIYKAEFDQPLDQQQYVMTTQSGRQSYGCHNTNDVTSLIQTGLDTASARDTAMIAAKQNLHYDYMTSSKEDLSYVNTERMLRTPDQQLSAESMRSQQVIANYNAQVQRLKNQSPLGGTIVKSVAVNGFARIQAMVNESTASEHSTKQGEDVDEFREVSFNGLRNSPRHVPVQALMPVLMNHSNNKHPQKNLNLSGGFSPRKVEQSEDSKNIEDYHHKVASGISKGSGSPQPIYNLDLIEEQSPVKERSLRRSQHSRRNSRHSPESTDRAKFYETSQIQKSKNIGQFRSQTSQHGAARQSSNRSSMSKSSTLRSQAKQSACSKRSEKSARIRSNCGKVSHKKAQMEAHPRGHSNGSEPSPTKSISPQPRIRLQDRAGNKAFSRSESRSAPAKTPSQERMQPTFDQPRIVPLRNPRQYKDESESDHQRSPSDMIEIVDQSSEEKPYGVNQDSFGFVQSSIHQKSLHDKGFSQKLSSIAAESSVLQVDTDIKNKIKLNHDKLQLQRMLEEMTMSVNTIRTKYTPEEIAEKQSRSQSRTRHHQSMQVEKQQEVISDSESSQRQGRFSCKTPRDIVQNCLSENMEQPPTEHTFRPNETSGRMTADSNFVKRYEERSLEAIRQSQMIIERHKRKSLLESPPKPHDKTPQPTSLTHVTEKEMRRVEQEADRLLDSRYMEPTETREGAEIREEPRSNLRRSLSRESDNRNYSREARRIIDDQNRIVELINMKNQANQGRNNDRPPLSPRRSFQTEPHPMDRPAMTDRPNTTRALDHQASYGSINRNLHLLNRQPVQRESRDQRDVEYFIQEYRLSQKHQQMQSRSRPCSQDSIDERYQSHNYNLESVKPDLSRDPSRQIIGSETEPMTYRDLTNAEPTTYRSNFTPGIETFCRKNKMSAVSDKDLFDIQHKTEQMCRQMTEARDIRVKQTENMPVVKDLRQQNDWLKVQNAQLQQEIDYYKQYAKEKQSEIFQLSKKNDELELDLADATNSQLFQVYKKLKTDYIELEAQHKSKSFNLDQQSIAMNTLLQQYEKLKESQLSLLAMNKQMLVSHQKEVSELQQNLSTVKTELRAKTEKVETYQEIMKSFNGQINEFEEFQQNSQRDMNTLSEQYKLYKELYEKESMQKQLLINKLQSGKLKVPTTYKQTADSGKQTKKRKESQKRRTRHHSSEGSPGEAITYLSSPRSEESHRERSVKRSAKKRKLEKRQERPRSQSSYSHSPDPTFRQRGSTPQQKQSRSITPLRTFEQHAPEQIQKRERSNSRNASAKQKKRSRNDKRASADELGLRSNFARDKKGLTADAYDNEPLTTQADDDFMANDREKTNVRHFQMLESHPDESTLIVDRGVIMMKQPVGRNSTKHSFRGQSQDYPPGREVQMNVVTPQNRITFMDQDQSYQQHEFDHISRHGRVEMENADQKTISQSRRSTRSIRSHSGCHNKPAGRITTKMSNNNSDWQDRNRLEQVSMSSIPKNFQGSIERTNVFYSDPTFIMGTNQSDQIVDAEAFIDGLPYKQSMTNQQLYGGFKHQTEEAHHRKRSSSLHRQSRSYNRNQEAAELIKRVASRSPSNYRKRKESKKNAPMSTKDYYLRLKQMQQRLDKARQDIQENAVKTGGTSRSCSPDLSKTAVTENIRLQAELSTIQEASKGRVVANHACARTKEQYRLIGTAANKRSLQTTLKFKSQPGAIKRKQSRSLSAHASTSNSAIRTAMAGGSSKHSIQQPTL